MNYYGKFQGNLNSGLSYLITTVNYCFRDEIDNPTKEKKIEKLSLMEHTRLKNMAICKRKLPQNLSLQDLVKAINALDIKTLNMDTVELLQRMVPVDDEIKKYREYTSAGMSIWWIRSLINLVISFVMQ